VVEPKLPCGSLRRVW